MATSNTHDHIHNELTTWLRPARATLIRLLKSIDRGNDASQEAAARALIEWPQKGVPDNPRAWLITVGYRHALDHMRRQNREIEFDENVSLSPELSIDQIHWRDDVLRLIFTCCHPALSEDVRIALTLNTVLDWTYDDIAHALLLPVDTLAQRVLRGKNKISAAGITYEIPSPPQWPVRLNAVLRVIYLLFNAGYFTRNEISLLNHKLCVDALQLARELKTMLPQQPEVAGLYALLLLLHARAPARTDSKGLPVLLAAQDRHRWDHRLIGEGLAVLQQALQQKQNGPYQTQAAINALHAEASDSATTDWRQIVLLYDVLLRYWPSPIVSLNQVVARLELGELELAGQQLQQLAHALVNYQPFYMTRAHWHQLRGDTQAQQRDLQQALAMATQSAQQQWLQQQLDTTPAPTLHSHHDNLHRNSPNE